MTSTQHEPEPVESDELTYYRDRVHHLESQLTAIRAVVDVGEPDRRRRCEDAAATLTGLLAIPDVREGAWESPHVSALDEQLRDVLADLEGGGDR